MKEGEEYQGLRFRLEAHLENARINLHVDIGFGDQITPAATEVQYPSLIGLPAPRLFAYPKETVVAEKFQALVMLGIINSRMKDFFDLWIMARDFEFDGAVLSRAIKATFERRKTALPAETPLAFSQEFTGEILKIRQWQAFMQKSRLLPQTPTLAEIASVLQSFLLPPSEAALSNRAFASVWLPGSGWSHREA